MIVLHLLVFLLLAATAGFQFNDPDPWFWSGFYAVCSLIPLLAAFKVNSRVLYGLCLAYGVAALALSGAGFIEYLGHVSEESLLQSMGPDKPYIEEAREFIGTVIALAVITVYAFARRRKNEYLFLNK